MRDWDQMVGNPSTRQKEQDVEKINSHQLTAIVIAGALAWRQKRDADLEAQKADMALLSPEEKETRENDPTYIREEEDEDVLYGEFASFLEHQDPAKLLKSADSNIKVFAALNKGEAAFTLRAQDSTASIVTRIWCDIQSLNPTIPARKLENAEDIVARMEAYPDQKWAD
jgi:hypothetical protein